MNTTHPTGPSAAARVPRALFTIRNHISRERVHPGVELRANLKSISHRCHLFGLAFVLEMTKEIIYLPLGCLQGGCVC